MRTWRIRPGQELLHRCWDEECALYNSLSGESHLVGLPTIELLLCLAAQAMSPAALAAQGFGAPAEIEAVLAELQTLHLIEPVPCSP